MSKSLLRRWVPLIALVPPVALVIAGGVPALVVGFLVCAYWLLIALWFAVEKPMNLRKLDPLDPRWVRRHNLVAWLGMAICALLFLALILAIILSA